MTVDNTSSISIEDGQNVAHRFRDDNTGMPTSRLGAIAAAVRGSDVFSFDWNAQVADFAPVSGSESSTPILGLRSAVSVIPEELWLETRQPSSKGGVYPVRSKASLPKGQKITVTVSGTYSAWAASWWSVICKGQPELYPQYVTETGLGELPNGPVGLDAEFMFAAPKNSVYCSRAPVPPTASLSPFQASLDNGATWIKPTPLNSGYTSDHSYKYQIQSLGLPLQFRINDHTLKDNYGRLKITLEASPTASPPSASSSHTFAETGFTVAGRVWETWQGGRTFEDSLYINGLPITSLRAEASPTNGKTYQSQWFERARFEVHSENLPPYDVLLGLLGVSAAKGRQSEGPFKAVANPGSGLQWFPGTQHTLGDNTEGGRTIAAYWTRLGGLTQFGLPISQPFMEKSKDNGKTYLVQYFERQRFEYHPENKGTRYEVLLGRLGSEQLDGK